MRSLITTGFGVIYGPTSVNALGVNSVRLNLRVEFSNFLNRTYLSNPTSINPTTPVTRNQEGLLTGGFGYTGTVFSSTTQLAQPRNGTIVARFVF